jgi:hypothetical protein
LSAYQRIAQSGFHCSLQAPPVTGVSKSSPVAGSRQEIVPALASVFSIGTCITMPVLGWIGKNGE